MKVLLTGGSGNLGQTLVPKLLDKGDTPVILDVRVPPPLNEGAAFIEGSVLDRSTLTEIFRGCDSIVHITAWHGIHKDRGEKEAYDFFDLDVGGTFEVFEAAASAGIGKVVFISTTSVYRPNTRYGSSKILAELIAEDSQTNFYSDELVQSRVSLVFGHLWPFAIADSLIHPFDAPGSFKPLRNLVWRDRRVGLRPFVEDHSEFRRLPVGISAQTETKFHDRLEIGLGRPHAFDLLAREEIRPLACVVSVESSNRPQARILGLGSLEVQLSGIFESAPELGPQGVSSLGVRQTLLLR